MANFIKVTVVAKDGISFIDCPKEMFLPCPSGTVIAGQDYYFSTDDLQQTWLYPPKPEAPALPRNFFPAAQAVSNGHVYWIIADIGGSPPELEVSQLVADACNTCCDESSPGGTPTVSATPADIIPDLAHMAKGQIDQDCSDGSCTYSYFDKLPTDAEALTYSLQFNCGGINRTSGGTTFGTIAAALAWAQANWGFLGTWALSGSRLGVSGVDCEFGVLQHTLS